MLLVGNQSYFEQETPSYFLSPSLLCPPWFCQVKSNVIFHTLKIPSLVRK